MNYDTKQRLLKLLSMHYCMLADDLKDRLLNTDESVDDIMSDYTVMLNECNELDELLRKESDHDTANTVHTDTEDTVKVEPTGITIKFTLDELQQIQYVVSDALKSMTGDDYFAQRYRRILQGAELKLREATNVVFGVNEATVKETHDE